MKRKILSLLSATILFIGTIGTVFSAEEVHPRVIVDDRVIVFDGQNPIISENNDTLIPVRGAFEAMGATVTWNGEDRSVYIKAKDNISRMLLKLDDTTAVKYTLTSLTSFDKKNITLSTAPRLMNEKTMVPLRVVCESFGADVDWQDKDKLITIKTKEYKDFISSKTIDKETNTSTEYNPKEILPYLYIQTDKTSALQGEEIKVNIKLANADKITDYNLLSAFSGAIIYDSAVLECITQTPVINGEEVTSVIETSNADFMEDSVKYVYFLTPDAANIDRTIKDGTIATFTFIVKSDKPASVFLSNRITKFGNDTAIVLSNTENTISLTNACELFIDTAPIVINKD